jgi:hypothetical protein
MKCSAAVLITIVLTACQTAIYFDPVTGFPVSSTGDRGEPGEVNPAIVEYIITAPEGPFVRYYDLMLSLENRPQSVDADLAALDAEARRGRAPGDSPRGRDYARALGRKVAGQIHDTLRAKGTRSEGTVSLHWGISIDLDAGLPLQGQEHGSNAETHATILRYQSLWLFVLRSSATRQMLAWDVSELPGAFQWGAPLDKNAVAGRIVALHPLTP